MGIRARSQKRVTQEPLSIPTPPPEKKRDLLAVAGKAAATLFRRPSCPDFVFCNQETIPIEYVPRSKSAVSIAEITPKKTHHQPISRVQMELSHYICPYYSAAAVSTPNIQPCPWPCPSPSSCPRAPKTNQADCLERLATCGACPCPCCPGCCPGCCLPPPCNQPPKCIQYMLGYYYYPYGFWFCGPYHVQGTCCPGGPVKPCGGPCGPCACPCCACLMSTASCFPWPEACPPVNCYDPCGSCSPFVCGPCAPCGQCGPCGYDPRCANCMCCPFCGPCYHFSCPPTPCSGPLTCGPCGPICQTYLCSQPSLLSKECRKVSDDDICFCVACRNSRLPPSKSHDIPICPFDLNPKAKFSSPNVKASIDPNLTSSFPNDASQRLCKRMALPADMGFARFFSTTSKQNTRNYEFGRTDVTLKDLTPYKLHSTHELIRHSDNSNSCSIDECPTPYEDCVASMKLTNEDRNQYTSSFGYINSPKYRKITSPYVYVPPLDNKQKEHAAMSL